MNDNDKPKIKQIRLSVTIADGDLNTRLRQAGEHLRDGCRVRLEMRMKGRQNAHPDIAIAKMKDVVDRLVALDPRRAVVERKPILDGKAVLAQIRLKAA